MYNVEPVTNTSSSSSCANNDDERRRECLARRLPPFVTALFFTLRHSYGLQYCRPVCSKARYSSRIAFPSYSNRKCKKSPFLRTAAHIFVSLGDASAIITQYVAWMERQFNACQTPRSMYLSVFRVIRCLSQSVSPKIAIFTTFLFPLGRPWGNHAKCCIDGKRIRCLQIVSLHVPI